MTGGGQSDGDCVVDILPTTASTGGDRVAGVLDWHGLLDFSG